MASDDKIKDLQKAVDEAKEKMKQAKSYGLLARMKARAQYLDAVAALRKAKGHKSPHKPGSEP